MDIQEHFYKCSQDTAVQLHSSSSNRTSWWLLANSHISFWANSLTLTDVNCLENLSDESPDAAKKLPVFQAKCPASMTDRSQTYISCTKWQCGTWCAVSGNFLRWTPRYIWERNFISTNTAVDYWLIAWSPNCNLCAVPHMNLKLGLQSYKSCNILQCWVHFELIALIFFNILYHFLDWIKDENGKH